MKIIKDNVKNELIIKKSKFICLLFKINNEDEINIILDNIKKEYKDATHYCYGYIVNEKEKYTDDNEPNGTAGLPILNVLKKNNLNNVLAVVIRYFGGIKLGAGGLIRSYSKSVVEALKNTEIIIKEENIILTLNISYNNIKNFENLIKRYSILDKTFGDNIVYKVAVPLDKVIKFKDKLMNLNIKIINEEKECN